MDAPTIPHPRRGCQKNEINEIGSPFTHSTRLLSYGQERRNMISNYKKKAEDQNAKRKRQPRNITFEAVEAVIGTSSIDMLHLVVGLEPCYPVCRFLPIIVIHREFTHTPPVPWSGLHPVLLVPALPPLPWAPPTADARDCLLSCASSSWHLTMNRSAASRRSRYHSPVFFCAVDHNAVSTPNTKGGYSVDPLVTRNPPRSPTYSYMPSLKLFARS